MSVIVIAHEKANEPRKLIGCDALLGYYLRADSDRMAMAASPVIVARPASRALTVARVTPSRAASPACVRPSCSRSDLYWAAVILPAIDTLRKTTGCKIVHLDLGKVAHVVAIDGNNRDTLLVMESISGILLALLEIADRKSHGVMDASGVAIGELIFDGVWWFSWSWIRS